MGIVRTVLISTIDLRNPKSFCKNLSLRKFKKTKIPIFPLYFWEYSLVKIKVQFWEGRWPRIKKFRKRKLLSTKFYRRKHLSQIRIWFFIFLTHPNAYAQLLDMFDMLHMIFILHMPDILHIKHMLLMLKSWFTCFILYRWLTWFTL